MKIRFDDVFYSVKVISHSPLVESTRDSEGEAEAIEFEMWINGSETSLNLFTDNELAEIERLIFNEIEKEAKHNNDEYLSEMAADRD